MHPIDFIDVLQLLIKYAIFVSVLESLSRVQPSEKTLTGILENVPYELY
jgi:hypothetical protein